MAPTNDSSLTDPAVKISSSGLFKRTYCVRAELQILRHSNVAITQACYIKTAREDAKAAIQKLETALNDTHVTPRLPNSGTKVVM